MEDGDWIRRLVAAYVDCARVLSQELGDAFGERDLLLARRAGDIPRSGVTDRGVEFSFHGTGCWVSDGARSVDFDFMHDGRIGGFDAWRLHVFSAENPRIAGTRGHEEIEREVSRLLDAGAIRRVEGGSALYVLVDRAGDEN